jgi:hypothetical protein
MATETDVDETGEDRLDRDILTTELEMLRNENVRLRKETEDRVTSKGAAGLFLVIAAVALAGAIVIPAARDVLIALGGTGAFGAVLILLLTKERLLPASVTRSMTTALGANNATLLAELEADGTPQYVPADLNSVGVKLFCPRDDTVDIPRAADLDGVIVARDNEYHGLSLDPSGRNLFLTFEALDVDLPDDPEVAVEGLTETVTEQFEIADSVRVDHLDLGPDGGLSELRLRIDGSVVGEIDHRDHPLQSFIAIGLARALDSPIEATFTAGEDGTVLSFERL